MSENTNLPTPIKNSSFEAPELDDGAFTLTLPTSWNIFDPFGFVTQNPTSTSSRVNTLKNELRLNDSSGDNQPF